MDKNTYKIEDFINPKVITFDIEAKTKEEVIHKLIDILYKENKISDPKEAIDAVLSREETKPTGLKNSIAVPYAKLQNLKKTAIAIARLKNPVDFQSLDGIPSKHIALFLIRKIEGITVNLNQIINIAKPFMDSECVKKLNNAKSTEEYYKILVESQNA